MVNKINYIFSRKQKIQLVILFFMILLGSVFELLGVSAVLPLVEVVLDPSILETEGFYRTIAETMNITSHANFCVLMCVMLIVVYIIKNAYLSLLSFAQIRFAANSRYHTACRMFRAYVYQDYLFHTSHNVADLQRDIMYDIVSAFQLIQASLLLITELVTASVLVVFLLYMDIATAIIMGGMAGLLFLVFAQKVKTTQTRLGELQRSTATEKTKTLLQAFGGIKDIQVMSKEEYFCQRFEDTHNQENNAAKKSEFLSRFPKYVTEAIIMVAMLAVVAVRIGMGANIAEFVSVLSVYAIAAVRLLPSTNRIIENMNVISSRKAYIDGLYDNMHIVKAYESCVKEEKNAEDFSFKKDLRVEGLFYKYPEAKELLFENASLTIHKNESVAFVGGSGAGKTTLADIILGLLPPDSGAVLVDSRNIKDNIEGWHHILGYVPQAIYLTDDTIRNNVAFGTSGKLINDADVWRALDSAQMTEFVKSLPNGLDTIVGDRGVKLSGGQRQRIGIARALFNNPQILILDEATSALDNETEKAIMEAIETLKGKTTMIIIAHRLSTIRNCDKIFEVQKGQIVLRDKEDVLKNA